MKVKILKRILPALLTFIMLLSAVAPVFATPTVYVPDDKDPYYSVVYEDGVLKVKLDADKLYETLRDGKLTGEELENYVPQLLLKAMKDGTPLTPNDVFWVASEYVSVDDLADIISTLPLDVLVQYFDIELLQEIVTIEELIAIVPVDEIANCASPSQINKLVNHEVVAAMLTEKVRNDILTDEFIDELLDDDEIVQQIIDDYGKELAKLIDEPIVSDILKDENIKKELLTLAESDRALKKLLSSPADLTIVKEYMLSHNSSVSGFVTDPDVIDNLYYSEDIRHFLETKVGAEDALRLANFDFDKLDSVFGVNMESLKNHKDKFGLTNEEIAAYPSIDLLIANNAIDLYEVCDHYGITVQRLFGDKVITNEDVAKLVSDHWAEVLDTDGLIDTIFTSVGLHQFYEHFDEQEIVVKLGGYYALIEKGYMLHDDVVVAIGGYTGLMGYLRKYPEKLEQIFTTVSFDSWADYGIVDKIVDKVGGYSNLVSYYTFDELNNILTYIGRQRFVDFLRDAGVAEKIDINSVVQDLVELIKSKKEDIRPFARKVFDRFTSMMAQEVTRVYLNGTDDPDENVIYKNGEFFVQQIVTTTLQSIPNVDYLLAMQSGDPFVQMVISTSMRGVDYNFGFVVELTGDLSRLQKFASNHSDLLFFEVSDDLDITVDAIVPAVIPELYERAILSNKIPPRVKSMLLRFPAMSLSDVSDELSSLSDDEIEDLAAEFSDKMADIKANVYKKLEDRLGNDSAVIEAAKARADALLEKFEDPNKLALLRDKAVNIIAKAKDFNDVSIADLYDTDGTFILKRPFNSDIKELLKGKIEFSDDVLILFGNDLTVSGTIDAKIKVNNVNKLSVIGKDGQENTFFLPAGFPLEEINKYVNTGYEFEKGALMPDSDLEFVHEEIYLLEFYTKENGTLIKRIPYSNLVSPDVNSFPAVPERPGYTGKWTDFTLYSDKVIKIYPIYTAIKFDLEINVNGETIILEDITVDIEELPLPTPEKTGHDFDGWFVDVNNDGEYDPEDGDFMLIPDPDGDGYLLPDDKDLPAGDFSIIPIFTKTVFNVNYYDKGTLYISYTYCFDTSIFPVPVLNPTPSSGFVFVGWFADLDGNGTGETPVSELSVSLKKDVNVYARYTPKNYGASYWIDGVEVPLGEINHTTESVFLPVPEKNHYEFSGWFVDLDGDGIFNGEDFFLKRATVMTFRLRSTNTVEFLVPDGEAFPDDSDNLSIVASFVPVDYFYTFIDKGNTLTDLSFTIESDKITLPTATPDKGKKFVGWYVDTDNDGDGDVLLNESNFPIYADANVYSVYEDITYYATFKDSTGKVIAKVPFTYGMSVSNLAAPSVPTKNGYTGKWVVKVQNNTVDLDKFTLDAADFVVTPAYTLIEYSITFEVDGKIIKTLKYTVENYSSLADIPSLPKKDGYTGIWVVKQGDKEIALSNFTFTYGNVTIVAKYTPIDPDSPDDPKPPTPPVTPDTYYVYFIVGNTVIDSVEYTEGDTALSRVPEVPAKLGYTGAWRTYELGSSDIFVYAIYTPIKYVASFVVGDEVIDTVEFTIEDKELSRIPEIPAKKGYEGKWSSYTLGTSDITITAEYTLKVFTATFMADGVVVGTVNFTVEDETIELPEVPAKKGYTGAWEEFTLDASDIVINAIYTPVTPSPDGTDTDDGGDDTTDDTIVDPDDSEDDTDDIGGDDNKFGQILRTVIKIVGIVMLSFFALFLLAVIIVLIVLLIIAIIKKKNDDDDDDDDKPEPPAPEPEPIAEPIPEPEPEVIEIVESVDIDTVDELMSDETAEAVLETVVGAGTGLKAIINISDINAAFENGDIVDIDSLKAKGLVSNKAGRIKVLADGLLDKSLTVYAEQFSVKAVKMITLTGGKAILKK